MRKNMSLLLHCLNLSCVSSHFQQMTIGNTYFIISLLNYRWDPRFSCPALLFLSRLWCSKNKKKSIFSRGGLHQSAPLRETSLSIQYRSYAEIKMLWISKMFVLRKRLFNKKQLKFRHFRFVVYLSLIQPTEGNDRFSGWMKVPDAFIWVQHA